MLSGKQKRYLRAMASTERVLFQIGKDGLSANLVDTVKKALKARELVKISILKSCETDLNELKIDLCAHTGAELVSSTGRTVVLYKASREKKIDLPHE